MKRSLTVLNECGDTTIVWDESSDDNMEEIIKRKMAEGITFFIVKPQQYGLVDSKKIKLENPDEARKHRALSIPDADLAAFVSQGHGEATTPEGSKEVIKKTTDPAEAAKSNVVAVKPRKGG
jgi:hypothetical protein